VRTKNGQLRRLLIGIFFAIAWAAGLRAIVKYLHVFAATPVIEYAIGLPVLVTSTMLIVYLKREYNPRLWGKKE
jgi:hypothetical protein